MSASAVSSLAHKYATLHCWGRSAPGQWWALISWHEYGLLPGGINGNVFVSAWVPATDLRPSDDPYARRLYAALERYDLPAGGMGWPTPATHHGQHWVHHGPITTQPPPIHGLTPLTGISGPDVAGERAKLLLVRRRAFGDEKPAADSYQPDQR